MKWTDWLIHNEIQRGNGMKPMCLERGQNYLNNSNFRRLNVTHHQRLTRPDTPHIRYGEKIK